MTGLDLILLWVAVLAVVTAIILGTAHLAERRWRRAEQRWAEPPSNLDRLDGVG